jgi:glucosyl-3-phosphoglycerate synthase
MDRVPAGTRQFTFAVVGRNEAERLEGMVGQALEAAQPGDRVWFVDSASEDDSIAVARGLGVEVVEGPAGKGRALQVALGRCESGYMCFLDADLFEWAVNIPSTLRAAAVSSDAAMVVGTFSENRRRVLTSNLYWPLAEALIPEYAHHSGRTPLSGLRVVDPTLVRRPLPPGYGVETYLNLTVAGDGHRIETVDLGCLRGPLRMYANVPEVGEAIATEILDFAVETGQLDPALRSNWDDWVNGVMEASGVPPPPGAPDDESLDAVAAAAARPFPPARRDRSGLSHASS